MICKKCGANNSGNVNRCVNCGNEFDNYKIINDEFISSNIDSNHKNNYENENNNEYISKDSSDLSSDILSSQEINPDYLKKPSDSKSDKVLKKVGVGCGIGCLGFIVLMIVLTILSSIFANSAIDKLFDRAESFANGYVEENEKYDDGYTYENFETTTDYSESTNYNEIVFDFNEIVFDKEKYSHPTIIMLNNDELQKITEVEAFRCGKIEVVMNFGSLYNLETNEGKLIEFDLMDDVSPDDVIGKYAFVKGIEDSEGNVYPEIIFLTDIDIKSGENK